MASKNTNSPVRKKRAANINSDLYWSDFKRRTAILCISSIGLIIVFSPPLHALLNTIFIQPFLKDSAKDGIIVDIALILCLAVAICYAIHQFIKRLLPSVNSLIIILTVLIIYYFFFRSNDFYEFYNFHIRWLKSISYWDFALISILIFITDYKSYLISVTTTNQSRLSLIEDSPFGKSVTDIYERNAYASHIATHIEATTPANAFAIGIIGEWGSGKTNFLFTIKEATAKQDNTIVVDFNPWRVGKTDAIIDDFFQTLSDELKPYNRSINHKIKEYSKKILQTGKEIQYRLFDTIIGELISDTSVQKQYDEVNEAIKAIAKKIIIFIDDVDRLTGKEVMEVLRIIRNTANFSNTFFLVGIDQEYIVNVLKNTKDFTNEEEYLKKVFQLTITLPTFKKEVLVNNLKSYLITVDIKDTQVKSLESAIKNISKNFDDISVPFYPAADHDNILEKMIDNVRDLKRFSNSFKIVYNLLEDEVDINDLMVLELIRNRNILVYNSIRNRRFLTFKPEAANEFVLDEKNWEKFAKEQVENLSYDELDGLKKAVEYLVTDVGYKNSRKFHSIHNFYLYFAYQLFDLVSLKEFSNTLTKDAATIINQFDKWQNEGKLRELFGITRQLTDFPDAQTLLKMIVVYSNVQGNHNEWFIRIYKLIFEFRKMNEVKYFANNEKAHQEFLKELMDTSTILIMDRAMLANYFLKAYIQKDVSPTSLVLSKEDWNEIVFNLFDHYLNTIERLAQTTLAFFGFNIIDRGTYDKPVLYPKARELFKKKMIENKPLFADYVKIVIRSRMNISLNKQAEINFYLFDDTLEQIFGDWKDFKALLTNTELDDEDFNNAKLLVLKYIDSFYTKNMQAFQIHDKNDHNKIKLLITKYQNLVDFSIDREDFEG